MAGGSNKIGLSEYGYNNHKGCVFRDATTPIKSFDSLLTMSDIDACRSREVYVIRVPRFF